MRGLTACRSWRQPPGHRCARSPPTAGRRSCTVGQRFLARCVPSSQGFGLVLLAKLALQVDSHFALFFIWMRLSLPFRPACLFPGRVWFKESFIREHCRVCRLSRCKRAAYSYLRIRARHLPDSCTGHITVASLAVRVISRVACRPLTGNVPFLGLCLFRSLIATWTCGSQGIGRGSDVPLASTSGGRSFLGTGDFCPVS